MKKFTAFILALVLIVSVTACAAKTPAPAASASASPSPSDTSITVTDMTGRVVKLDKPASKIVAITASDCEIVYALGAGSTIVGRGEYCDYPAEVSSVPSVQSGADTNIEQIIALKPDVVLMSTMDQTKEQVASLESSGIKVIESDAQNIAGVYTAIEMIGSVTGKSSEAKTIIDGMKKTFDEIKAQVKADGTKTIYFEVSPLAYGLYAAGSGTFMDEIATMLGLKNIFADMPGWPQVSEEQVIQRNPDYIVTTSMSNPGAQSPVDEVMSRKGWGDITAIKNKMVNNADSNALTRPGPRLAEAAKQLYSFIYGG
jgi:iron complex transport system substrate-binding protein